MRIDEDGIADSMSDRNPRIIGVFDIVSGQVAIMQKREWRAALFDKKRYVPIPKISQKTQSKWMREFVRDILSGEHPLLAKKIISVLKEKGDRGVDDAVVLIAKDKENWIDAWNCWKGDSLWTEILTWFETLPVSIESSWDEDDCELCKLAKQGSHTMQEFIEAKTRQADQKGAFPAIIPAKEKGGKLKERVQDDYYYDAMDSANEGDFARAERLLREALKLDEHNVQTYVGLANVYGMAKEKDKSRKYVLKAYEKTVKQFPQWPEQMEWGLLRNRRFLRAIQWRAELFVDEGDQEKGIDLYRQILRMNPSDNQGVRYVLAGLYAGVSGDDVNRMFDAGNETQNWDALERMVSEQNKKHTFWKKPHY